ncbi:hypothetical protein Tco_0131958, partial [Tanacetum coccineum]
SPSSSLVQTSSALGDGGTNSSDLKSELNLRTFLVMNEIDGSGGVEESEWVFFRLSFSSSPFYSVLSLCDSPCSAPSIRYSIGDGLQYCVDFVGHHTLLLFEIGFKLG